MMMTDLEVGERRLTWVLTAKTFGWMFAGPGYLCVRLCGGLYNDRNDFCIYSLVTGSGTSGLATELGVV